MREEIGRILGNKDYDENTRVELDSLSITELIFVLEDDYQVLLTFPEVKACKTWGDVELLVEQKIVDGMQK